jgi:LacI family transcriptional regulator
MFPPAARHSSGFVVSPPGIHSQNVIAGAPARQHLLRLPAAPTAALCFNDMVAIGAIQALSAAGQKPGLNFAPVGFNDVAEARLCRPPLTTVATTPGKIGEMAAELLVARIAHADQPCRKLILRPSLIVRESCGSPFSPYIR